MTIQWAMWIYLLVGTALVILDNKRRRNVKISESTIKQKCIINVMWGLFVVLDLIEVFKSLYRSKTDKTLQSFQDIEDSPKPKTIGFVGYSGVGKDTAANYLIEKGFNKYSFASALKAVCFLLYGHRGLKNEKYYNDNRDARKDVLWTDEEGKEWTPVDIWVAVGTKLREVHKDTWLDTVPFNYSNVVIADVRHPNELERIQKEGGIVIYLDKEVEKNPSATMDGLIDKDDCDVIIDNNGTLEELYKELDGIVNAL